MSSVYALCAGSISQLTLLLCGSPGSNAATGVKWDWYCSGNNYVRKLITGVVPPLILTFWQGIVVPRWFYYWCQVCFPSPCPFPPSTSLSNATTLARTFGILASTATPTHYQQHRQRLRTLNRVWYTVSLRPDSFSSCQKTTGGAAGDVLHAAGPAHPQHLLLVVRVLGVPGRHAGRLHLLPVPRRAGRPQCVVLVALRLGICCPGWPRHESSVSVCQSCPALGATVCDALVSVPGCVCWQSPMAN